MPNGHMIPDGNGGFHFTENNENGCGIAIIAVGGILLVVFTVIILFSWAVATVAIKATEPSEECRAEWNSMPAEQREDYVVEYYASRKLEYQRKSFSLAGSNQYAAYDYMRKCDQTKPK